jgi:MFS family permease
MSVAAVMGRQIDGFRGVLTIRDYRRLWLAQVVSTFGDRFTQLGLTTLIFVTTGSEVGIGVVLSLTVAPQVAFSVLAGVAADRVSRKRLLVTTDLVRAAIVLALAMWAGLPIAAIYLLTVAHATGTVFFTPTRYAMVPELVGSDRLLAANALDETSQNTVDPLAYLAAGILIGAAGLRLTFGVDALTFVASALLIGSMVDHGRARAAERTGECARGLHRLDASRRSAFLSEAREGFAFIWEHPVLRANTVLLMLATLVASSEFPLSYMLVLEHWKKGPFGLGLIEAGLAAGVVLGGFLCGWFVGLTGRGLSIIIGLLATGICMAAAALLPFAPAVFAMAVSGVFNVFFFVPTITLQQEAAPDEIRARVLSTRRMYTATTILASYVLATVLVRSVAAQDVLFAMGTGLAVLSLGALAFPVLRAR